MNGFVAPVKIVRNYSLKSVTRMNDMTKNVSPPSSLLTPTERAACRQIQDGAVPYSQYAKAFLALDDGATQAQAAEAAGLRLGQLRYWLDKFRRQRLAIFPPEAIEKPQATPPSLAVAQPVERAIVAEPPAATAEKMIADQAPEAVAATQEEAAAEAEEPGKPKKEKAGKKKAKKGNKKKAAEKSEAETGKKGGKKKKSKDGDQKKDKKKGKKKGKKNKKARAKKGGKKKAGSKKKVKKKGKKKGKTGMSDIRP